MINFSKFDFKSIFGVVKSTDGLKRQQTRPLRAEVQEIAIAEYSGGQLEYVGDVEDGRDFLIAYMKHKQKVGGTKKIPWSNGAVNSHYRRLRAFFNFISMHLKGYPFGFMNRIPFAKTQTETITFTSTEIKLVKSFMTYAGLQKF